MTHDTKFNTNSLPQKRQGLWALPGSNIVICVEISQKLLLNMRSNIGFANCNDVVLITHSWVVTDYLRLVGYLASCW